MRYLGVVRKAVLETRRDLLLVALSVCFAPAFVVLEWFAFPALAPAYTILLVDLDRGAAGDELAREFSSVKDGAGRSLLTVVRVDDNEAAARLVQQHKAAAAVTLPAGFARDVARRRFDPASAPASLTIAGDLSTANYVVAAVLAQAALDAWVTRATGRAGPVKVEELALGESGTRTDFELYVPGLLVFAVILMIFQAAMTVARDTEAGTLRRLQLTRMTSLDYLAGTSTVLLGLSAVSVSLTFATALALGFRTAGPPWLAMLVVIVTSLGVIGAGFCVAALTRTTTQAFVLANFPMGLLMFFSGAMFPLPRVELVQVAGRGLGPFDLLPTTHAVVALGQIFTHGAGPGHVAFELAALVVLSLGSLAAGVALLRWRSRRAA